MADQQVTISGTVKYHQPGAMRDRRFRWSALLVCQFESGGYLVVPIGYALTLSRAIRKADRYITQLRLPQPPPLEETYVDE